MDLEKLLDMGESETVEFKETFDRETLETVVAFANTRGGAILIGVNNAGGVKGAPIGPETIPKWSNQISQATEPTLIADFQVESIEGKTVVAILVKEYPLKPVSYRGRCYRRIRNSNRVMSPQEIAHMHLQSTGNSWDALPAPISAKDWLDVERIRIYLQGAAASGRRKIAKSADPIEILKKIELIKKNKPTWAAVLLFGKNPQSPLTQATIHCGRFKEEATIIDDRLISGSLIEEIDEALDFIRKNIRVRFHISGEAQREEIWDYPLEALREAVINAVCHRDYSDPADIQIKIYEDSLQIWNPGGLPFDMTVDDLLDPAHSSRPRNKLIAQVFYDMGLIERYGSGIQRMIQACRKSGLPDPVFEEKSGGFAIRFQKSLLNEERLIKAGLNKRQIEALRYAKEKGRITNIEYQEEWGVSKATATRDLALLIKKGFLVQYGKTGRGTFYKLKGS